jgi:arginine/ornithine N-succinyltransferase beta subunit
MVKLLNREAFGRASQYLLTQARPLERALFEHRFEGANMDKVIAELAGFQNEDGGFGQALEADLRTPRGLGCGC